MKRFWWVWAWAGLVTVIGGLGMGRHLVPFVPPAGLSQLALQTVSQNAVGRQILHIIDPRCNCSNKVIEFLQKETSDFESKQTILTFGEFDQSTQSQLLGRGFTIHKIDPKTAKTEFNLQTVPWLVVLDRDLTILYSGGYAKTKVRDVQDLEINEILEQISTGATPAARPAFGCVTSQELRNLLLQF